MVPPVPIPNTVVKHSYAESTCLETGWEDRALLVKQKEFVYTDSFFILVFYFPDIFDRVEGIFYFLSKYRILEMRI